MLTRKGTEQAQSITKKFGFLLAILVSYGAILLALTRIWQLCIIPPAIAGLLFIPERARLAWWSGFIGVALAWLTIVLYFVATQPAMQVADMLMQIIIGRPGLGIIGLVLTIIIGACLGGFGGLIGFAIQTLLVKEGSKPERPL
nr:hypothetical protein [Candidatus Sigynarchaeota archaeon]